MSVLSISKRATAAMFASATVLPWSWLSKPSLKGSVQYLCIIRSCLIAIHLWRHIMLQWSVLQKETREGIWLPQLQLLKIPKTSIELPTICANAFGYIIDATVFFVRGLLILICTTKHQIRILEELTELYVSCCSFTMTILQDSLQILSDASNYKIFLEENFSTTNSMRTTLRFIIGWSLTSNSFVPERESTIHHSTTHQAHQYTLSLAA